MKNIITSTILLITLFLTLAACSAEQPEDKVPSGITDNITSVAEATETEKTTVLPDDDIVTPPREITVYYDNDNFSFSDDLLTVTDGGEYKIYSVTGFLNWRKEIVYRIYHI